VSATAPPLFSDGVLSGQIWFERGWCSHCAEDDGLVDHGDHLGCLIHWDLLWFGGEHHEVFVLPTGPRCSRFRPRENAETTAREAHSER
jgi:hypothetical protein